MPVPVIVPTDPLAIDEELNGRAEDLLATIAQVVAAGTLGSSSQTSATYLPPAINPRLATASDPYPNVPGKPFIASVVLESASQQLFYRQLSVALAKVVPGWSSPNPPTPSTSSNTFIATCASYITVGHLVRINSSGHADICDISNASFMPSVGVVVQKLSSLSCKVQVSGVASVASPLVPGEIYYVGSNSKLSERPTPAVGQSLFLQPVAVSISPTSIMINPSLNLVRVFS